MSCHDKPSFSRAVDQLRADRRPQSAEWPALVIVGATCIILGVLITVAAYEIGRCV